MINSYNDLAVIYLGPLEYEEKERSWCTPSLEPKTRYESFFDAKTACSVNDKCAYFYDSKGRDIYYLCDDSSRIKYSSKGSIQHIKYKGTYIIIKLPLTHQKDIPMIILDDIQFEY